MVAMAQGRKGNLNATCTVAPNRVDFGLSPVNQPSMGSEPKLNLIDDSTVFHSELLRIINELGTGAIKVPDQFDRAALFVQFASIEPNVMEANRAISATIPERYRPKLTNEEAFVLQVNLPRAIPQHDDVRVNFLTKWSVEQFQVFSLAVQAGGFQGGASAQAGMLAPRIQSFLGACITFDCSLASVAKTGLLDRERRAATFLEGLRLVSNALVESGLNFKGFSNVNTTH